MAEKTSANLGFEKQLWDAACYIIGITKAIRRQIGKTFGDEVAVTLE